MNLLEDCGNIYILDFHRPPLSRRLQKIRREFAKQYDFVMDESTHLLFVGGVGASKTYAGAIRATRAAMGWIGSKQIRTPNLGIVTAPTQNMIRDAAQIAFRDVAMPFIQTDGIERTIMQNGSIIHWRSVADSAIQHRRGPSASWWWADEAAMYSSEVRPVMVARLRQFGQRGHNWATTTPKGRNWLYKTYIAAPRQGWSVHTARTSDNPYLDDEYYEMLKAEYHGDHARQELDAEFISFAGLVYSQFSSDHVDDSLPTTFDRVIAGVDWGFANPGCIVVVCEHDGRAYVVEEIYQRNTPIDEWVSLATYLRDKWRIETFYCDPSDPTAISQFNEFVYAQGANNKVLPGIRQVQSRIGKGNLRVWRGCSWLLREIEQYQWQTAADGSVRDLVLKSNDHAMDALRYAIMGLSQPTGMATAGEIVSWR